MPHKKVVIIGGGISGIKAAIDLYNGGIKNTVILESSSRLGGRLLTIESKEYPGITYDFGASWFHDCLNNPLLEKAKSLGHVAYYFDDGKCVYFNEDSKNIDKWKFETILDELITYGSYIYTKNPEKEDLSVKALSEEYIGKYHDTLTSEQINLVLGAIRMWTELWLGESWDLISGKYFFNDLGHLGRNAFVKNGYKNVFINELKELPRIYRDSSIKFNAHVTSIDYGNPERILIKLKDGRRYTCDYVISTIPQSLLKISNPKDECFVEWIPEIPPTIKNVLPDVSFSSLGKVVFEFDECFWPRDVERFYGLSKNSPLPDQTKPWDYPTILINYQVINNIPALIALTKNPLSKYIEDLPSSEKSSKIWSIFKPVISQISTIGNEIPKPKAIYHTPWNNNPLARGSYGASLVGTQDPSLVIKAFVEGHQDRIRFAGAETMDDSSNGCAHGAWFSGKREAEFILIQERSKKSKL